MANNPTASKQYVLPLQFVVGDITTGTVAVTTGAPGLASASLYYKKLGNLYFDMRLTSVSGGYNDLPIGAPIGAVLDDTFNEIASIIGVTINTKYTKTNLYTNVNDVKASYNSGGVYWGTNLGSNPHDIIDGFLAN